MARSNSIKSSRPNQDNHRDLKGLLPNHKQDLLEQLLQAQLPQLLQSLQPSPLERALWLQLQSLALGCPFPRV